MLDGQFPWAPLLSHLPLNAVACRGILRDSEVMTTGSGPYSEADFDRFLGECEIDPAGLDGGSESRVLVVGRADWDEDAIDAIVADRAGETLRVYSQEMVVASLALGADVFDVCSAENLAAFGEGHPALEYLMNDMDFDWPSTEVVANTNRLVVNLDAGEWPESGVLSRMGYKTGRSGLVESARREILDRVMQVSLVPGSDGADEYIEQWGTPSSARRLGKMANCLASFARTKKLIKTADYSEAIADWESDLEYLRTTYYRSTLGFSWPDTSVPRR
jgi:hypothetical protein